MNSNPKDQFFSDINFSSIIDTIKGVYISDGSMATLIDFERVLDEADIYAFRNWILGELVKGPVVGRYSVSAVFMWPYKLMPDPAGIKRLSTIGCNIEFAKNVIKVPVKIESQDDFITGTKYPKLGKKKVWYVKVEIPTELMGDIKEGSIDLAGSTIDLGEIDDAYDDDLDKGNTQQDDEPEDMGGMDDMMGGDPMQGPDQQAGQPPV